MISLVLDENLDRVTFKNFFNMPVFAGVDFHGGIVAEHPEIDTDKYERYIEEFY